MKLYQDQSDRAAQMRPGDTPVDESEVITAIVIASQAEFPGSLECVTGDFLLMAFFKFLNHK